jgi:23S rRNA pseudouridine1911/1915/1917 synthase
LVHGRINEDKGEINAPIGRSRSDRKKMSVVAGGKEAITKFKVLKRYKNFTLMEVKPITGRTHQIRVHLSYIGNPIVGDTQYGRRRIYKDLKLERQFLHATRLEFNHPKDGKRISFMDDLPEDLKKVLKFLENRNIDF